MTLIYKIEIAWQLPSNCQPGPKACRKAFRLIVLCSECAKLILLIPESLITFITRHNLNRWMAYHQPSARDQLKAKGFFLCNFLQNKHELLAERQ